PRPKPDKRRDGSRSPGWYDLSADSKCVLSGYQLDSAAVLSFLATLFRPMTIWSASSRVASGVKVIWPLLIIFMILGAANQRPRLSFSPGFGVHWQKMA